MEVPDSVVLGGPGRLLVVDDQPANRRLLRTVLEARGHQVLEAGDGEEGLDIAVAAAPDAVLLDVMMPGLDGYEVCRRLKADPRTAPIPVLMITSLHDREARLRGMEAGANDFLAKPVDIADVVLRVRNAVYTRHLFRELQETSDRLRRLEAQRLDVLLEIAGVINSSLDLDEVFDRILGGATGVVQAESGSLMLMNDADSTLRVVAVRGPRAASVRGRRQKADEGIAGWVVRHRQPLLLHGTATEPFLRRVCDRTDVRDAVCVPLQDGDRILGVLNVSNPRDGASFTSDDVALMTALANQATLAVRNAQTFREATHQRRTVERLLHEVTRSQEAERSRIAGEIHDGPAQTMFAALRAVEMVRRRAAAGAVPDAALLTDLEQTVRKAISDTRAVMIDLQPPSLEAAPLSGVLENYVRRYGERVGIRAGFQVRGQTERLPPSVQSCLYRIAQEALANVWKHAAARQVWVQLESTEQQCCLEIRDDGCGFDPAEAAGRAAEHLGLGLLRERAELAGGHLAIQTAPGQGTTVRVTVPLFAGAAMEEDE